jgi:hypothetical protein
VCVVCCAEWDCGSAAACLGSGVCVVCCAEWDCGGVAACLGVACVLCAVQNETVIVWQHVLDLGGCCFDFKM